MGCGQIQWGRDKRQHQGEDFPKGFQGQTPWTKWCCWWKMVLTLLGLKGKEKHVEEMQSDKVKAAAERETFFWFSTFFKWILWTCFSSSSTDFVTFLFLAVCYYLLVAAISISVVAFYAFLSSLCCLSFVYINFGKMGGFGPLFEGCMRWWSCGMTRLVQAQVNFNGKV